MSSKLGKRLGKHIRSLRKAKGLTQEQLEEKIGRPSPNYVTRVERGMEPPLDVIDSISDNLDVSVSDLFFTDGIDNSAKELRAKIQRLIETDDVNKLRKFYRLLLVASEK
jgi:transcriptional regulator with XRE-family HTH domain